MIDTCRVSAQSKDMSPLGRRASWLLVLSLLLVFAPLEIGASLHGGAKLRGAAIMSNGGQPPSWTGVRVVSGYAQTVMEDHFDTGNHYMHHIVHTADGEDVVVEGLPHGSQFRGEWVVWNATGSTTDPPPFGHELGTRFTAFPTYALRFDGGLSGDGGRFSHTRNYLCCVVAVIPAWSQPARCTPDG